METVWEKFKFPTHDLDMIRFPGHRKKLLRPYCWTPTRGFSFGDKVFIPLYPCIAFETPNFGYVAQKLWDTVVIARE